MVAGFALVRALGRGSGDAAPVSWSAFLLPLGTLAISAFARHATTDQLVSPAFRPWLDPRPGQWAVGMADLRAFALLSATPLLFAWTLAHLARRRLSRMGAHAAFLALAWMLAMLMRHPNASSWDGGLFEWALETTRPLELGEPGLATRRLTTCAASRSRPHEGGFEWALDAPLVDDSCDDEGPAGRQVEKQRRRQRALAQGALERMRPVESNYFSF